MRASHSSGPLRSIRLVLSLLGLCLLGLGAAPGLARAESGSHPLLGDEALFPGSSGLALDLGYIGLLYGGKTIPRFTLSGDPDHHYHGQANGLGLRVVYDLPGAGLDWRFKFATAFPSYAAASATLGIRRNLSPSPDYRLMGRVGAGLEALIGGKGSGTFLAPVLLGEGELALLFGLGTEDFSLGPVVDLNVRYGFPFGFGIGADLLLRAEFRW